MANRKDLSPELQLAFANADVDEAEEYLAAVLDEPETRPSQRLKAALEVQAAKERRQAVIDDNGLWEELKR